MTEESILKMLFLLESISTFFYISFLIKMQYSDAKVFGFWHFIPYFTGFLVWLFCFYIIYFQEINSIKIINFFHNFLYLSTFSLCLLYFTDRILRFINKDKDNG